MEHIKECIVCLSKSFEKYLNCVDYLVSKELFSLLKCKECGFAFTSPRPSADRIWPYYKSEEYCSHKSESKSLISLIYNKVRQINIGKKVKLVQKANPDLKSILDYGCGAGFFLQAASEKGLKTKGLEPSPVAREIAISLGVDVEDNAQLFELSTQFDVITLWHVLEHIHNIDEVFAKLKSLLAQGGKMVIAVPNIESWDAKHYQEKWAAYDVPRHLYHFSTNTIEKYIDKFGMRIVSIHPMKFDSYYVSLISEEKSLIAYFKAVVNGFISNFKARSSGNYSSLIYIIE